MGATSKIDDTDYKWDASYDVVVIGYGYAGAVTALEAADGGSSVLLIEKMQDPFVPAVTYVLQIAQQMRWPTLKKPAPGQLQTTCWKRWPLA